MKNENKKQVVELLKKAQKMLEIENFNEPYTTHASQVLPHVKEAVRIAEFYLNDATYYR